MVFNRRRNSFSKTDPDATFMHLKEDHMRNAQLKPAYNLQLGVEGEYITGFDISSERSDQLTLIPLIDKMDKNIGVKYQDVTADAGYESEENYTYFENKWCYVKITDTLNLCFLVKSAKCTNWSHLFHGLLDNEPLMA